MKGFGKGFLARGHFADIALENYINNIIGRNFELKPVIFNFIEGYLRLPPALYKDERQVQISQCLYLIYVKLMAISHQSYLSGSNAARPCAS